MKKTNTQTPSRHASLTSMRTPCLFGFVTFVGFVILSSSAACGGGAKEPAGQAQPASSTQASAAPPKESEAPAKKQLPSECKPNEQGLCLPPQAFSETLCGGAYPEVALSMFRKGTPWTRGFLRRTVDAWNASGRASSNDKVEFDEEVILLTHKAANTGGMVVSGATGSYQALRWNGTCVSLMGDEVTQRLPPKAKHAKIPWKELEFKTRDALSQQEKIGAVVEEHRKECKGSKLSEPSAACKKIDAKLSGLIVDYVRNGGELPEPEHLP